METAQNTLPVEQPVRTSLQERKQEFARNAIWDAAIGLFFKKGFDETTVDEIAEAAGTSRRSFFRHFESKSDLMAQPVVDWGNSLINAIHEAPSTLSTPDLLREVVFKVAEQSASNPRSRKLMEIAAKYPTAREAQLSRVAGVQDRLAQAFRRRCTDDITAHLMAGLIFAILSATHQHWFEKRENDISGTVQKAFVALSKVVCDIESSHANETTQKRGKG
jgi:AcrR family transcriptional regulator